jgi:hypothetical protein
MVQVSIFYCSHKTCLKQVLFNLFVGLCLTTLDLPISELLTLKQARSGSTRVSKVQMRT